MKDSKALAAAAVAGLFAMTLAPNASAEDKPEKCYGIVKAQKNDCKTASGSCAGSVEQDAQADAWIYLPQGTCEKIIGGSLTPKTES
ncbi:MAG: BufA1 family periplasmic bufferin-type metallophore [Gammaproteobacteria bacterium]